ncbi:hypothetical protein X947_5003 [Burkholderia pseudomallei MSHR7334]|nr:hypothetical protein X947_5003 [Burkholderia pseudomallei MSHR7334]
MTRCDVARDGAPPASRIATTNPSKQKQNGPTGASRLDRYDRVVFAPTPRFTTFVNAGGRTDKITAGVARQTSRSPRPHGDLDASPPYVRTQAQSA